MRSKIVADLVLLRNNKCDLNSHAQPENYRRVEFVKVQKTIFILYVDKNDSVYDICYCKVNTWKTVEEWGKKRSIPDEFEATRDLHLFNKIKGNPFKIAVSKIIAEIDMLKLLA